MNTTVLISACTSVLSVASVNGIAQTCAPTELNKILANDGSAGDGFGTSVAVSGDVAIVGAPTDEGGLLGLPGYGSAYIYRFDGSQWMQEQKLQLSEDSGVGQFGFSVAIDGDIAVIGSPLDNTTVTGSGAIYVYRFNGSTWDFDTQLFASDAAVNQEFGFAVDITGETIAVGAPRDGDGGIASGSVYLYSYDDILMTWIEEEISASDADTFDRFGQSVAIDDTDLVVGAYHAENGAAAEAGAIYIFEFITTSWNEIIKLQPSDGAANDQFGISVDVDIGVVIAGANNDDEGAFLGGSAYIFRSTMSGWDETKISASDAALLDQFGESVSISGDTAVIGAEFVSDVLSGAGAAYLFNYDGSTWNEEDKLIASDADVNDHFGSAVAVSGDNAIIGAVFEGENGNLAGAAYGFDLDCESDTCPPDLTGEGDLNFLDVSAFLTAFGNQDPVADFVADGSYNFLDVSEFLAQFSAGCP